MHGCYQRVFVVVCLANRSHLAAAFTRYPWRGSERVVMWLDWKTVMLFGWCIGNLSPREGEINQALRLPVHLHNGHFLNKNPLPVESSPEPISQSDITRQATLPFWSDAHLSSVPLNIYWASTQAERCQVGTEQGMGGYPLLYVFGTVAFAK